jgi:hypothetical protein
LSSKRILLVENDAVTRRAVARAPFTCGHAAEAADRKVRELFDLQHDDGAEAA